MAALPADPVDPAASANAASELDSPLVSVVITTYNYARFLPGAIEGALAQTYPKIEVVVVDDGSTDHTREVVDAYASRGVRYVYQGNLGPGPARNRGLRETKGLLVAFCDADDVFMPDKIATQLAHLRRHPEVGLVSAHGYATDEDLRPTSIVHAARGDSVYVFEALLVRNVVLNPTCVLARRSTLESVGGFSDLPRWEDWDTWLRVAKRFPIGFVDQPVAWVRRHDASLSPIDGGHRLELDGRILARHIGDVASRRKRAVIRVRARSNAYFHAATTTVARGERRGARRFAIMAFALDPFLLTERKAALVARTWMPELVFERARRATGRSRAAT
jgi:glycosyltransferase involved in cell wall biosynthesis